MSPRLAAGTPGFGALRDLLDGQHAAIRARVRAILARPDFHYYTGTDTVEYRECVFQWCQVLADEGIGALALPIEYGGEADFGKFMAAFETIATHDISLTIKFTVQFGLWLGSVLLLGTQQHHRKYLREIGSFALPGCFAMTEIGHGSNVRDLETTAIYDSTVREFIIHSPSFSSGKNYIGNGASHGRVATVFAQLETIGTKHGVHAFLVPIRDEAGRVLPGVRIEDNGLKMGENGVDNARLWFDQVRIPRESLLDRFASVAEDGTYASPIASPGARFFATISALIGGRISIAAAALSAGKSGLAIAVRYGRRRRQFQAGASSLEETLLLDYPTHQRRLLPLLANAYALDFAHKDLVRRKLASDALPADAAARREVERLAAGLKAYTTWNTTRTLQVCRETCGGEGYICANRLPALKSDSDIFTTFEGDNTVLMLWIGRNLINEAPSPVVEADSSKYVAYFKMRERVLLAEWREQGPLSTAEPQRQKVGAPAPLALFHAAQAYIERIVLECFTRQVLDCESEIRPVLQSLCDLFALSILEAQRGWFLEHGCFTADESKRIAPQVDALCAELARDAEALVDAFGIPPECLAAPIAFDSGACL